MSRKNDNETESSDKSLEIAEIIEPSDNFDVSVLKSDFENAEKQAKEAMQEKLIEKADFQKSTEKIRDEKEPEIEKELDFNEAMKDALEFVLSWINPKLAKKGIDKFDDEFMQKFVDKLIRIIPANQMDKVYMFLGAGSQANSAKRLFRLINFINFVSREVMERVEVWQEYRKAHPKPEVKKLIDKIKEKLVKE